MDCVNIKDSLGVLVNGDLIFGLFRYINFFMVFFLCFCYVYFNLMKEWKSNNLIYIEI